MQEPSSALQYLKELRQENGRRIWSLRSFNQYLDAKARQMGVPLTGQFELTPLCNFSCKMCYVHLDAEQLKGRALLSVETWKDLIHQAWEAGMMHVTLSGGECLTYPGFEELYVYLNELGLRTSIFTNGVLIDDHHISLFKIYRPRSIRITLYGATEDEYEAVTGHRVFHIVYNHIIRLRDAGQH